MNRINIETNIEKPVNTKRKTTILVILLLVVSILSIILIPVLLLTTTQKQKLKIIQTDLYVDQTIFGYTSRIKGIAKNTNEDYSYVSLEFSVLDAAGNNLGTTTATITNLSVGDTWAFTTSFPVISDTCPSMFKLVSITVW